MKALTKSSQESIKVVNNINNERIIKSVHGLFYYRSENGTLYGKNDGINGYKSYTTCVNQAFNL